MNWTLDRCAFPLDPAARGHWERLAATAPHSHPQRTWWWAECWVRHFALGQAELLAFNAGGETRVLLPLALLKQQEAHVPVAHSVLTLTGDGFSDVLPLLVAPGDTEALEQVAGWLESQQESHDELRLAPLIESGVEWPLRHLLADRGWTAERIAGNPVLSLESGWEAMQVRVGRNLRQDVGKKKRRMEEAGIATRLVLERECTPGLLGELEELARRRHEAEGHKSVFLNPARRAFIHEISALATERGEFACFLGRNGNALLGYRLGFLHQGTFFDWVTSYDPALFPYSIGKLLLWDIVERLCELSVPRLDFMAGEEDYKLKWLPEVRGMHRCQFRRRSAANLARELVRRASKAKAAWTA